jgi:serine/threonine protein kinase
LTFNERVGKGKFGEVYRGSWDSEPVAIKALRPKCEEYAVEQFRKEANIMRYSTVVRTGYRV